MSSADKSTREPLSSAEKQRRRRARLAAAGIAEVRGIHAHTEDHDTVREKANKHAATLAKSRAAAQKRAKKAQGESNE